MDIFIYVLIALVVCALVLVKKSLVIIPQSETKIIERLGKYYATLKPGINIIIPFIDRAKEIVTVRRGRYVYTDSIDLREQVYDFDKQNVITKDNVQTQINALLYFQIVDPFKAVYEISNLPNAIEKLTQTTLRNIIGELELDQTLTSRDTINTKLRAVLDDDATVDELTDEIGDRHPRQLGAAREIGAAEGAVAEERPEDESAVVEPCVGRHHLRSAARRSGHLRRWHVWK